MIAGLVVLIVWQRAPAEPSLVWSEPWQVVDGEMRPIPGPPRPDRWLEAAPRTTLMHEILLLPVRSYQVGTDNQDSGRCPFHPSCSVFAMLAVQKFGPFQGGFMAADRLLRCNPWSLSRYHRHEGLYRDPPSDNLLWGSRVSGKPMRRDREIGVFAAHLKSQSQETER